MDHDHVCVMYNSVFSNTNSLQRNIGCDDQVVIIFHDSSDYNSVLPEKLVSHGYTYELRYIACTEDMDGDFKWDGKIYCRHGKEHHKSWWFINRRKGLFLQSVNGDYDDVDYSNIDVSVYVVDKTTNMERLRNNFMHYIGGQTQLQCSEHKLPIIVNKTSMEKCYMERNDSGECCNRKLYYKCPTLRCGSGLCKRCYENRVDDVVVYINPPDVESEDDMSSSTSMPDDVSERADDQSDHDAFNEEPCV